MVSRNGAVLLLSQESGGPENIVAPVVTQVTGIFYTTDGTWTGTGTITYAYQWQADGVDISGATSARFICTATQSGTDIRCVITATDDNGSTDANSNAVAAVVGPIAYYTLDAADGSDETGNYDLTTYGTGAITTTAGVINNANVFNGSNFQSNFVGSFTDLNSASDITIAGWFNSQDISAADFAITITQNGGDYAQYVIRAFESKYQAEVLFDGTYFSVADSGVGGDGVWHHITAVFSNDANGSSGSMSIYADGVFKSSASYPSQWVTPNIEYIGVGTGISASGASYSPWDGYMDDVRIYNRALSSAEVTALYDWSIEQQDITTNLTHYWRPSTELDSGDTVGSWDGTDAGTVGYSATGADLGTANGNYTTFGSKALSSPSYTVCIWAAPDVAISSNAFGGHLFSMVGAYAAASTNIIIAVDTDGTWRITVGTDGGYRGFNGGAVVYGSYQHISVVVDDTARTTTLYINGVFSADYSNVNTANTSARVFAIGTEANAPGAVSSKYHGEWDDCRLYEGRALTSTEITALYDWSIEQQTIDDYIARYTMDDATGADETGTYDGTWNVAPTVVTGVIDDACTPNGDFLVCGGTIFPTAADWTFSTWYYVADMGALNFHTLVAQWASGATGRITIQREQAGNVIGLRLEDGAQKASTSLSGYSGWTLVTFVRNYADDEIVCYLNGVQKTTGVLNADILSSTTHIAGTNTSSTYSPNAPMDDTRIYNRALTSTEITALYEYR